MGQQLHLACYDVACPRRLRAALDLARRLATGGQKSVHECWLGAGQSDALLADYAQLLDVGQDRVLLIRLDGHRASIVRGCGTPPTNGELLRVE